MANLDEQTDCNSVLRAYRSPLTRVAENAGKADPVKVVRCALENAASGATVLLTRDALIAEKQMNVGITAAEVRSRFDRRSRGTSDWRFNCGFGRVGN